MCHQSNLNGENHNSRNMRWGMTWNTWRGKAHSLRSAQMAVKPMKILVPERQEQSQSEWV